MNGSSPQWWASEMENWGLDGKEDKDEDWLVVGSSYWCGDILHLRVDDWICRVGTGELGRDL